MFLRGSFLFLVPCGYSLFNAVVLFCCTSSYFLLLFFATDSFSYYAAWNLPTYTKLFQLLPKVFIRHRKSQLSTFCIFMAALILQNWQEREKREERVEWNIKMFLKNRTEGIKEIVPIFILIFM